MNTFRMTTQEKYLQLLWKWLKTSQFHIFSFNPLLANVFLYHLERGILWWSPLWSWVGTLVWKDPLNIFFLASLSRHNLFSSSFSVPLFLMLHVKQCRYNVTPGVSATNSNKSKKKRKKVFRIILPV